MKGTFCGKQKIKPLKGNKSNDATQDYKQTEKRQWNGIFLDHPCSQKSSDMIMITTFGCHNVQTNNVISRPENSLIRKKICKNRCVWINKSSQDLQKKPCYRLYTYSN